MQYSSHGLGLHVPGALNEMSVSVDLLLREDFPERCVWQLWQCMIIFLCTYILLFCAELRIIETSTSSAKADVVNASEALNLPRINVSQKSPS